MDTAIAAAVTAPGAGAEPALTARRNRPPGRSREDGAAVAAGAPAGELPAAGPPAP